MQVFKYFFNPVQTQLTDTILIDGKRNYVVESYAKMVLNPSFDKCPPEHLDHLKRVFSHHKLPFSHPAHKKVNETIAKTPLVTLHSSDVVRGNQCRDRLLNSKESNSPQVFVQNCSTLDQLKQLITEMGATWQ